MPPLTDPPDELGEEVSLRAAWDQAAEAWIRWAREPNHDTYWRFARKAFFDLVPPPGRLTLDVGCGEGRVARDLASQGHRVVGADSSRKLVVAAARAAPTIPT
ncbi:MAG: class I SAM-dependent methyltransferase, partial [Candidatus Dormibacterales bacterium]